MLNIITSDCFNHERSAISLTQPDTTGPRHWQFWSERTAP
jgi:hypothetical protein